MSKTNIQEMPELTRYKVAAIQYEPEIFNREQNVAALLSLAEEAASNDAKIIVMPEMATTGICFYDRSEAQGAVEPIPGPTSKAFHDLAEEYGCYLAYGEAEVDPTSNAYYNSSVLVGPDGVVGTYRKTHLFLSEPKWAQAGDLDIPIWKTEYGNIGMIICHDAAFPETTRVSALKGADIICFPTNWLERSPSGYWFTRAFDNGVFWIAANRYGEERSIQFSGNSCVIDPEGDLLASHDVGNGVVYAQVDLELARHKGFPGEGELSKFTQRRPDFYHGLMLHRYLWNPNLFHGLYGHRPLPPGQESTLAVVQMKPVQGNVSENKEKIEEILLCRPARDADLVVFPELATTGLIEEGMIEFAETIPGPTVTAVASLCRETGNHVILGVAEHDDGNLYNAAVLIGPNGLVGRYRQLHLDRRNRIWANAGDKPPRTYDISVGRIGLLVGHDINFPEASRLLALEGADAICVPAALTFPNPQAVGPTQIPYPEGVKVNSDPLHWILWRQRSTDDSSFIAIANQHGNAPDNDSYLGLSAIFSPGDIYGPRIEVIAPEEGDMVVTLEMDTRSEDEHWPSAPVRLKEFLGLRQTQWYEICHMSDPPVLDLGD